MDLIGHVLLVAIAIGYAIVNWITTVHPITQTDVLICIAIIGYAIAIKLEALPKPGKWESIAFAVILLRQVFFS